jgi:hypothetical protein
MKIQYSCKIKKQKERCEKHFIAFVFFRFDLANQSLSKASKAYYLFIPRYSLEWVLP